MDRNLYRVKLADGSSIERCFKTVDDVRVPYGNWKWKVYDPDRRPRTKTVNLRTRDRGAALRKAGEFVTLMATGALDPWSDAAPRKGVTLDEAADRFLAEKRARGASEGTVETDRGHLDRLSRALGPAALVRHVTERDVQAFVDAPKRDGSPRKATSKSRARASVLHFFGWAVREGLAPSNPAADVEVRGESGGRGDHLTGAEEDALVRAVRAAEAETGASRAWLLDWVTFACRTGLRPKEQAELRWAAVDLERGEVRVGLGHRTKTAASRRVVPVRGEALAVLRRLAATGPAPGDHVFSGATGSRVAVDYLSKTLKAFAEAAGIPKTITAYSTRHAYGTRMVGAGVPVWDVAKLMGTSVAMIEKHYGHHDPARSSAHVERVFG